MRFLLSILVLFLLACNSKENDTLVNTAPVDVNEKVITQNLQHVWEMLWGPDDHLWITERSGRISRVNPTSGAVVPLITITDVMAQGEGGLLGMALHPNFTTTPHVFVAYNYNDAGIYKEKVVRFAYNGTTLVNPTTILDNIKASSIHNGCRLLIAGDKLFVTTGDAADQSLPQNTQSLNGKILRLNLDGSIPADNPISGSLLWSWGHRNPQGLTMVEGKLFSTEHGPDSNDELNIIEKGRNYGWPTVKGACDENAERTFCTANNIKEPIKWWTPTLAVCGTDFYNSNEIPQWKNSLLIATLKSSRLYAAKLNEARTEAVEINEYFTNTYGRLRDVCIAPSGKVYLCSSNGGNDKIVEVSRK